MKTKMITSGSLAALQEFLASWIAKDRNKHGHYFTSRVPKMAVYGAFISAPLGHVMISILQKTFRGRTSLKAKILQILVSNLIVRPYITPHRPLVPLLTACPPRSRLSKTPSTSPPWPSSPARAPSTRSAPPCAPASCP